MMGSFAIEHAAKDIRAGLEAIAKAINNLAEAIRTTKES